jgi:hypothetical protein
MASKSGKTPELLEFTTSRRSRREPLSKEELAKVRKEAARKAAETRANTKVPVILNGERTEVTLSQLAGLKAAAKRQASGTAQKAAQKAAASRKRTAQAKARKGS